MRCGSIRRLITLGMAAMLLALAAMGVAGLLALSQSGDLKARLYVDAQSLHADHALELAAVRADRDFMRAPQAALDSRREASRLVRELHGLVTTSDERRVVGTVERKFAAWQNAPPARRDAARQELRAALNTHRDLNARQMEATVREGQRLETRARAVMPLLLIVAGGALFWGALGLWERIFQPALKLSSAAKAFGEGDLTARVPVSRDDEMGRLCQTFNGMADALQERERERMAFVATVAHDLKNPLVVIGGAARLVREKALTPEQETEWLGRIERNTRSLEGIIADLTDGVAAHGGRLQLRHESLCLSELGERMTREFSTELGAKHRVRFEGDAWCPVLGDRARLERVVVNLLSNACKYSPADSEVTLSVWRRGARAVLSVRDEGAGISSDELQTLFKPFARLPRTRNMASGAGLGLHGAKNIIEAHGGGIEIHSAPGRGTTVEIALKLHESIPNAAIPKLQPHELTPV